jgi:hypothetical protein
MGSVENVGELLQGTILLFKVDFSVIETAPGLVIVVISGFLQHKVQLNTQSAHVSGIVTVPS